MRIALIALVALLITGPVVGQAPTAQLPTIAELQEKLKAGKTAEVLTSVTKLLALRGDAAKAYDRSDLFSLRGEATLRNKTIPPAADAFASAAKEATDPKKKAIARGTEILLRKSKTTGYTPKPQARTAAGPSTRPTGPIPIIEEEDRKQALAALYTDEMTVLEPKLKAAGAGNTLIPVIEVARSLSDLGAIEMAGTGANEQTKTVGGNLGKHAHTLIKDGLTAMTDRTEKIWQSASKTQRVEDQYNTTFNMAGLTSIDANNLKDVIATSEKILVVATQLGEATGSEELKADGPAAEKIRDRAKEVLTFDYANSGRPPTRIPTTPQRPGTPPR